MSYHEYPGRNDTVTRRHYNGRRVVDQGDMPFDSLSEQLFREASPDSRVWSMAAESAMRDLKAIIGQEAYRQFIEMTFPDIEVITWRDICHMVDRAYFAAKYRCVRDVVELSKLAYVVETYPNIAENAPAESIG